MYNARVVPQRRGTPSSHSPRAATKLIVTGIYMGKDADRVEQICDIAWSLCGVRLRLACSDIGMLSFGAKGPLQPGNRIFE